MATAPLTRVADGVRIEVRLSARADRDAVDGPRLLGEDCVLGVRVSAPAADGRANAALIALLAKTWRLAKSDMRIVRGVRSRRKCVHVRGDPAALSQRLGAWIEAGDA